MENKTNCEVNGKKYYRIDRVIGHEMQSNGKKKAISKAFYGKSKKETEARYQEFLQRQKDEFDSKDQVFGVLADKWIQNFFLQDKSQKIEPKIFTFSIGKHIGQRHHCMKCL